MRHADTPAIVVLLRGDAEVAAWALSQPGGPDLAVVDELARLQLAARRLGLSIRLRRPCPALVELLDLVGMADEVGALPVEVGGQAEGGEQVRVDEVVVRDDPVA